MLASLNLLTGRRAVLVCNLAATQYNVISGLDQFQLSDPNLLTMVGRTRVLVQKVSIV